MKTNLSDINDYSYQPNFPAIDINEADREVQIYRRANGDVAIRNELWIIPTVGCVVGIANQIRQRFLQQNPADDIDGVFTFLTAMVVHNLVMTIKTPK